MIGRRIGCCHTCLAFILKFLNFLQSFVGICIIVYSIFMLNQWNHRIPIDPPLPPPVASPPSESDLNFSFGFGIVQLVSGIDDVDYDTSALFSYKLPSPWFIYAFMVLGVMLCFVNCIGLIAAESIHGCCLCFYSLLKVVLILLEISFVAFVALDHHWEKDLPFDPTGELDSLKKFIAKNLEICKWIGITILIIQAVSLLLAFVLRATISTRTDDEYDDNYDVESTREALIQSHPAQTNSYSSKWDNIWSSRIRDKYGLGSADSKQQV